MGWTKQRTHLNRRNTSVNEVIVLFKDQYSSEIRTKKKNK